MLVSKRISRIFFLVIGFFVFAYGVSAQTPHTDPNLKVAFIGDTGYGADFEAVLNLIRSEGAAAVVHQGDFDYAYNPSGFFAKVDSVLGANFPYFASVGNHDDSSWDEGCSDPDGCYAKFLKDRMSRIGVSPDNPDLNDHMYSAVYKGLKMVFVGQNGSSAGDNTYAPFIQSQLQNSPYTWSVCSWHKNQNTMQVGGKGNDMGWKVYETCRELGAIIATAHEHTYHRTKTLTNIQSLTVDTSQHPPVNGVPGNPNSLLVSPGKTFVFVSGIGGNSIRNQDRCLPASYPYGGGAGCNYIWASIYTSDQNADYGALFITFNVDGNPNRARGYFKDISGNTVDQFEITKSASAVTSGPTQINTQPPNATIPPTSVVSPTSIPFPTQPPTGGFCTFWRGIGAVPSPGPGSTTYLSSTSTLLSPTQSIVQTPSPIPTAIPTTPPIPTTALTPPVAGEGIWISQQELASLPTTGAAWSNLKSIADGSLGSPNLADQDTRHNLRTMAVALVYARIGGDNYRSKAADAIISIIGTENNPDKDCSDSSKGARSLALGRNLAAYVIAADLINLHSYDTAKDQRFRSWLPNVIRRSNCENRTIITCHEDRPNNWGTMCGASRIAADLYLNDNTDLQKAIQVYKGYIGDRSSYASFKFASNAFSFMCDTNSPRPINPVGCVKDGHDLSGAPVDDIQRAGAYKWPPGHTDYAWGGFSAAVAQAELLYRAGYDSYNWQDRAIYRGTNFLENVVKFAQSGGTTWVKWIVNRRYNTNFSQPSTSISNRLISFTDWTHAK